MNLLILSVDTTDRQTFAIAWSQDVTGLWRLEGEVWGYAVACWHRTEPQQRSSEELSNRNAEARQVRIARQLLADVDQLWLLARTVDRHRAVVRVDHPHQGD